MVARGRSWSLVVARGRARRARSSWPRGLVVAAVVLVVRVVLVRRGLVVGVVASLFGRGRGPRRVCNAIVTFLLGLWGGRAFLETQALHWLDPSASIS